MYPIATPRWAIVKADERRYASGITHLARNVFWPSGRQRPASLQKCHFLGPIVIGGGTKICSDLLPFRGFFSSCECLKNSTLYQRDPRHEQVTTTVQQCVSKRRIVYRFIPENRPYLFPLAGACRIAHMHLTFPFGACVRKSRFTTPESQAGQLDGGDQPRSMPVFKRR